LLAICTDLLKYILKSYHHTFIEFPFMTLSCQVKFFSSQTFLSICEGSTLKKASQYGVNAFYYSVKFICEDQIPHFYVYLMIAYLEWIELINEIEMDFVLKFMSLIA